MSKCMLSEALLSPPALPLAPGPPLHPTPSNLFLPPRPDPGPSLLLLCAGPLHGLQGAAGAMGHRPHPTRHHSGEERGRGVAGNSSEQLGFSQHGTMTTCGVLYISEYSCQCLLGVAVVALEAAVACHVAPTVDTCPCPNLTPPLRPPPPQGAAEHEEV